MSNIEFVLTEEFVAYSKKIASLLEQKKQKELDLKKVYEEHKSQIKGLEEKASKLTEEFEVWKKNQRKSEEHSN